MCLIPGCKKGMRGLKLQCEQAHENIHIDSLIHLLQIQHEYLPDATEELLQQAGADSAGTFGAVILLCVLLRVHPPSASVMRRAVAKINNCFIIPP